MKFNFRVSPNYRAPLSTQRIMFELTLAILVVLSYNVFYYFTNVGAEYGWHALKMIATSVSVAVVTEVVWAYVQKKDPIKYLKTSFPWVTALLFVAMMGVNKPLYVVIVGSFVAIFVGKLLFGGFGFNIFNPAGVGRAFVVLSFGGFIASGFPDVITGATPNQVMEKLGWVITDPTVVNTYLNQFGGLWGLATGQYMGALGETNSILIILVGLYLAIRGIIDWKVPFAFLSSLFIFASVIALMHGMGFWYPVYHLLTGSALFGAVFMMTDPVTSPTSITGRLIFAIGIAALVITMRVKANLPEGTIRSILFMNMLTPMIDQLTDGHMFKDLKKNLIKVGGVFALGLSITLLLSTMISYIEPVVAVEEPEVVITLGDAHLIVDARESIAEVISKTDEGTVSTFVVNSKGYALLESDHAEDPQPNTYEIKVDTSTQTVVSVAYVSFSDTTGIGDKTNSAVFLDQFIGLSLVDPSSSVDVVTGATFTSDSAISALKAVALSLGY